LGVSQRILSRRAARGPRKAPASGRVRDLAAGPTPT